MTKTTPEEPAAPEYSALLDSLIKDQDARKSSLEQRGLAVITTCGTLATLLFGLVALTAQSSDFSLPRQANGPLGLALLAFVLAALCALCTNLPLQYTNIKMSQARNQIKDNWNKGKGDALQRIAAMRMQVIDRAQKVNTVKAWLLVVALFFEFVAVVLVAVAVSEILRHT